MSVKEAEDSKKSKYSRLSIINLVLIIIMAVIFSGHISKQQLININLIEILGSIGDVERTVDFSNTSIQTLGNGFMLSQATQNKHLTGIRFTGRIINSQSVDHLNSTFNISVDGENKEFTINRISSGNSTAFNVYIPDISAENSRLAQISYVRSSVSYYTK